VKPFLVMNFSPSLGLYGSAGASGFSGSSVISSAGAGGSSAGATTGVSFLPALNGKTLLP